LSIQTKINKGKIEIINDVTLLEKSDRVGASQATLLQMLNIKPFSYGCKVQSVYDNGQIISAALLDMTDEEILNRFRKGVARVASLALQIGYPTLASLPHSVSNGYRTLVSVALATKYSFKQVEEIKKLLDDPEALKKAQAAAAAAAGGGGGGSGPAAGGSAPSGDKDDKKKKKGDDDDDDDGGGGGMGGLFGDDDDDGGGGGGAMGGLFGDAEED